MAYTVRDWMNMLVIVIDPELSVADALSLMRRRYIHSLVVDKTESNPDYGIITSTDICYKIIAEGLNPIRVKVRDIMSSPVKTADAKWSLEICAKFMKEHNIHHMPVISEDGNSLIGMISTNDLFVAADELGRKPKG
jgi:CBS domain-containing protein